MLIMVDVDLGLNIPYTPPLKRLYKLLMVIVEVDIGPILPTLPPITQVTMV